MTITLEAARATLDEALRLAIEDGSRISVAIVDDHGREVCSARMDGATWFTLGVALSKAQTAATFARPTHTLAKLKGDYPELFPHIADQLPFRPTVLPGGIPLETGTTLGAVGVSGAHPDQDQRIAEAAARFFAERALQHSAPAAMTTGASVVPLSRRS